MTGPIDFAIQRAFWNGGRTLANTLACKNTLPTLDTHGVAVKTDRCRLQQPLSGSPGPKNCYLKSQGEIMWHRLSPATLLQICVSVIFPTYNQNYVLSHCVPNS